MVVRVIFQPNQVRVSGQSSITKTVELGKAFYENTGMAAAVVEQPINQLSRKLESTKIDVNRKASERPEFPISNQQVFPSFPGETFHSNASVASSEMIGDGASSYCSREEYPELTFVTAPNGFMPSHGTIYAGSTGPVMNTHGYIPYQMEGMHYYNPVVDYNYGNQTLYSSHPAGMHYPAQANDGYLYGPQVYQYPVPPYYQQAPIGQYVAATPTVPAGGMMMLDPQDSGVVVPNGFNNYAGPIPGGPPMTFVPPSMSCENGILPIAVSYPSHAVAYPSHTLRASAPAWIEPCPELKGMPKECKPVEVPAVPQLSAASGLFASNKVVSSIPVNGALPKSNPSFSAVKVAAGGHISSVSAPLSAHRAIDMKESGHLGNDGKLHKKENGSLNNQVSCAIELHGQENGMQAKGQQYAQVVKPAKVLSVSLNKEVVRCLPNGERYNSEEFVTKYDDAKHFIIKSYSEENVYRSIQYGVWASTPNGNKKLDDAYHDAQRRAAGKPHGCPVFLFFSVNGSRQFCGVAEMTGSVDYKRSMEFWEQHKWSGSFPVKWRFIKDVPNSQFRRVILQNNENKPVTNSRDTQEVFFQQGLEMLNIVKSYPARTSILDEFPLCHMPTKAMVDVKPQQQWSPQSFPKIGEQIAKGRSEEPDLKSPRFTTAALKVCDNGAKSKETTHPVKPVAGKVSPAVLGQDSSLDKDRRRVDKENIKFAGKEGVLSAA